MPSEAADVDHGKLIGRRLKDRPVVVELYELSPVRGRAASGRQGKRNQQPAILPHSSLPQPLPLRPPPRLQIQPRMLNALDAPLALVCFCHDEAWGCAYCRVWRAAI